MSIITTITPAVQTNPAAPTFRFTIDQIADAIRFGRSLDELAAPAETDTTDHADPFEPTAEDAAWWASACDHSDWPRENELSPSEQDAELEHLDMLEERAAMVASWDRYEAGFGW